MINEINSNPKCVNCAFAIRTRLNKDDINTVTECRAGPPQVQVVGQSKAGGWATMLVQRVVPDTHWCFGFLPRQDASPGAN
jgi:hypothetical protein